ncbi:coniferyl aldehyde dehydrogenase (plasmid) [Pseudoalteromonas sp. CF6-2]|uniref:coniferyl aldehyde dehydrogenase n=1 Tax=Pseudoalteromonas sp. CF6-2 TaxID=562716 RepID=UPI001F2DCA9A|nr:coniferyl aldehyde dehydrogenase [Pseudoalteromonas sp. CF6-2]
MGLINQFEQLNNAFLSQPFLPIQTRINLLKTIKKRLIENEQQLVAAVSKDFGYRTSFDTVLGDLLPTVKAISDTIKRLPKWTRNESRSVGISLWPSHAHIQYQPKGVVGVIAPWNYPIQLSLVPVISALAAGNRVMLKLSEFTPHTNAQLTEIFKDELANHCVVIEGGPDIAAAFSDIPFAHLLFTGSTSVGRKVMQSASQHLTPVTLELGGKSPVVVLDDVNIKAVARTLLFGKLNNAGQICVAPDYVFVPKNLEHQLIQQLCELYKQHYQQGVEGKNLTSIISSAHYERLSGYVEDAQSKDAQLFTAYEENTADELKHRMGLHILTQVSDDMKVMQEEIFGPILPIMSYDSLSQVTTYINSRPHPLALYIFGHDSTVISDLSAAIRSGTLAINDVLMQVTADQLPFGGIGESGMGHYHGIEGFKTFSHARNTLVSGKFNPRTSMLLKQNKLLIKLLKWMYLRQ